LGAGRTGGPHRRPRLPARAPTVTRDRADSGGRRRRRGRLCRPGYVHAADPDPDLVELMTAIPTDGVPGKRRGGFTLAEVALPLGALPTVAVVVAQLATWSLTERIKADARLQAVEAATNLLEEARAQSWNELTPEWAAAQRLPDHIAQRWPQG